MPHGRDRGSRLRAGSHSADLRRNGALRTSTLQTRGNAFGAGEGCAVTKKRVILPGTTQELLIRSGVQ